MESQGKVHVSFPRRPFFLSFVRALTTDMAKRLELPETAIHQIEMAVSEAASNIIEHSCNQDDPIHLSLEFTPEHFRIILKAHGKPYYEQFQRRDENFLQKHIKAREQRGYGIAIMKKLMDEVHYRHLEQEINELELIKYR